MTLIKLPHIFQAREYQRNLMNAVFNEGYKHALWIVHRRAGKSLTSLNMLFMAAMQKPGLYLYLLPQSNQTRRVIWLARGSNGVKFLDYLPAKLIKRVNNIEMMIETINGSIIQFAGSNNYNALMGLNALYIFYDEMSLSNPMAHQLLSPILLEAKGTQVCFGTPRGHNHFFDLYEMARQNPQWYVKKLTIEDTKKDDGSPIITLEQIEEERRNGKSPELIDQEYYCSFESGNQGAYYTEELAQAEYENRIRDFDIRTDLPVHTSWDIGISDSTSICLFQQIGDQIFYIGYIEGNNKGVQHYKDELESIKLRLRFNKWGYHFGPHDLRCRDWGNSARSRLAMAAEIGLHFIIVPALSIQDRITAGRAFIRDCVFHRTNCIHLLRCLRETMRKYDEVNKVYSDRPLKNWSLHGFDSFTYGAVAWRDNFSRPDQNSPIKYKIIT